jgi:hypothetical protein
LRELGEERNRRRVVDGPRIRDSRRIGTGEDPLDRHFELLAGSRVRNGRHGNDFGRYVPGRQLHPYPSQQRRPQLVTECGPLVEDHEQWHPLPAAVLFESDDECLPDSGDRLGDHVDLGTAQPDSTPD